MTRQQYLETIKNTFINALDIVNYKVQDYATEDNPFKNFEAVKNIGIPVEVGILVRLMDKISRINNLLTKDPAVVDENIEDSILDAINYLAILRVWIIHTKNPTTTHLKSLDPLTLTLEELSKN